VVQACQSLNFPDIDTHRFVVNLSSRAMQGLGCTGSIAPSGAADKAKAALTKQARGGGVNNQGRLGDFEGHGGFFFRYLILKVL
jgi:hypothetical protein